LETTTTRVKVEQQKRIERTLGNVIKCRGTVVTTTTTATTITTTITTVATAVAAAIITAAVTTTTI
jgi:predicted PurR-regulated permease PerM